MASDDPPARFKLNTRIEPNRRVLVGLLVAGLLTRLVWVFWIHPPQHYVFSDMAKYVERAEHFATHGIVKGVRPLAWQVWGTHYLYALPLAIFGKGALWSVALLNAVMGGLSPALAYLLACRACRRHVTAAAVGIACLLWHPNLSLSGYFLSETPFLFFQLWSTYRLVVLLQEGRGALAAGLISAAAFAIRPQSAAFFLLVFLLWAFHRRRLPWVRPVHLVAVAAPLLATLLFSMWRFQNHTGYWSGIAENANMNFTAGRCHNIVTQAFPDKRALALSNRRGSTRDGRRVSLPGFRILASKFPAAHPLALRPALGHESIKFVGYVGDPHIHRDLRRRCYEETGLVEQARYSMVNTTLLWFFGKQWPEMEKNGRVFYPFIEFYRILYQVAIWLPSLVGMFWALMLVRVRPVLAMVAFQLVTSMAIASIFFGAIRLRTPYDPYAILLAAEVYSVVLVYGLARWRARRSGGST